MLIPRILRADQRRKVLDPAVVLCFVVTNQQQVYVAGFYFFGNAKWVSKTWFFFIVVVYYALLPPVHTHTDVILVLKLAHVSLCT